MADQWDQWAANINAANGVEPGNIYKNYAIAKVGVNAAPAATTAAAAGVQANDDKIAQANADAAAKVQAQQAADANDPGKAQMVLRPDNQGYAFYDGTGKQISINQFSLLTGKRPDQLLADSPVPKDQKFVQDYQTLMKLSNAWVNGDTKTLATFRAADPKKFNQLISTYKSPADMVNAFTQHWGDYYSPQTNTQSQNTGSFAPTAQTAPTKDQWAGNPDDPTALPALAGTNLNQVLTPNPKPLPKPKAPAYSGGIKGIFERAPGIKNLTGRQDLVGRQQDLIAQQKKLTQANPWFAYHNSLYGN